MLTRTFVPFLATIVVLALAVSSSTAKPTTKNGNVGSPAVGWFGSNAAKNPTQTFCTQFNAQCYLSAIEHKQNSGSGGNVQVVYACKRKGRKYSKSFAFGCKADGDDITQQVLNKIGSGYTVTTTATSTAGGSVTVTDTTTYPVTATAPTSTITTYISTSTSVSTSFTSTVTQVALSSEQVPVVIVSVPNTGSPRKRATDQVDATQFCSAFSTGCVQECNRVSSTPKHTICRAGKQTADALQYTLACYCANQKIETQHALRSAVNQQHVATVSTVTTSTSLFTVTASTPKTVATTTPKTTKSDTTTTTTTTSVASTTKLLFGATGAVQVINGPDGTSLGYIAPPYANSAFYIINMNKASAQKFIAVVDASTGLYSLQQADASGKSILLERGLSNGNFAAGSANYAGLEAGAASLCGKAATKGAPADGSGPTFHHPCEVFGFGAQLDASTVTTGGGTLNLAMMWYNSADTAAKQYTWSAEGEGNQGLFATGDPAKFQSTYSSFGIREVSLRFPA